MSGTVSVAATASDNVGVVGVQFKLDGANLGSEDASSPYTVSWNTATASNGAHSLTAVARDAAGNQTQSYWVPGEANYWGGLDLVGDGTFWASNAYTANIYHFDLQSGAILGSFNTGTGGNTAAGVGVRPIRH